MSFPIVFTMVYLILALVWASSAVLCWIGLRANSRRVRRLGEASREAMASLSAIVRQLEDRESEVERRRQAHVAEVAEVLATASIDPLPEWRDALERKMDLLTLAVAEGIERVDRAERRIRTAVAGAKKKLREAGFEDAAVEAEAQELRIVDGSGSEDGEVPALRSVVEEPEEEASSVSGVTRAQLLKARGIGA